MEILFYIGTAFLIMSILSTLYVAKVAWNRLRSAKSHDYLEEHYDETRE